MPRYKLQVKISKKEQLTTDIFCLTVLAPQIAAAVLPGQFIMVRTVENSYDPLWSRPFSIYQVTTDGCFKILFKVVGKVTARLAGLADGDLLDIVGPLGRGFSLAQQGKGKACLVGGGIGIAPLFYLASKLLLTRQAADLLVLVGAAQAEEADALTADFTKLAVRVITATDDGSVGHHGFVTELIEQNLNSSVNWTIYSCGPYQMLKKVSEICLSHRYQCQVSLETIMACGMGSCLGCAIPVTDSTGNYQHVCKNGPVFNASKVAWL